jgi:lipid-binding SYLF domain-containing protein
MKTAVKRLVLAIAIFCVIPLSAQAASRDEQRAGIQRMQSDVLGKLYRTEPGTEKEIASAVGYAVFSSADVAALFVSGSYGHGLAHDNRTGKETYMQMASAGVGLGLGIKDFRAVFIFNNTDAFRDFVDTGLDLSGHADVAAKQGAKGDAISGAADILPGVKVYQLTDTGLLAQVMLKGTKYWKDSDLNEYDRSSDASRHRNYNQ